LPFARVSLKSLISKPYDFEPISVGDHIRKKRLQLGLFQWEAAQQLGVHPLTVLNWEKGRTEPPVKVMPAIFRFLGYDPFPIPQTLSERLLAKRRVMGLSISDAAELAGIDPGTWGRWERGGTILYRQHCVRIAKILDLSHDALDKETMANRIQRRGGDP
jgi:transcriptional regulator with XRE-family HTH domain